MTRRDITRVNRLTVHVAQLTVWRYILLEYQELIHVVSSLDHVATIQRNWKTLSFAPFVATFLKRLCLPSKEAAEIVDRNLFAEDGPWGLFVDTHNAIHKSLALGPGLDDTIRLMLQSVSSFIDHVPE